MSKTTIKENILISLLEAPKKTGQIAKELKYINKKTGYGKYNVIKPECNTLVNANLIHKVSPLNKTPGNPGTTFDIVYTIQSIKKMVEKYPDIIPYIQNNDKIISLISDQHNQFIKGLFEAERDQHDNPEKELKLTFSDLKYKMEISQRFLKLCLLNNSEELEEKSNYIYLNYESGTIIDECLKFGAIFGNMRLPIKDLFDTIFKACVFADVVDEYFNDKATEYIQAINRDNTRYIKTVFNDPITREQILKYHS